MRPRIIQLLFVALIVAAGVWWISAPTWEPVVAVLAGLIGLLTFRSESLGTTPTGRGRQASTGSASSSPASPGRRSVAVLPFENRSDEREGDYFSVGVSDDIIARLAKIPDLKVISRTSVMGFKEGGHDLREIARELQVSSILEGSVRRAENRVRIIAKLTDTQTSEHLWVERYDRELTDIFGIQAEVADQVARALDSELSSAQTGPGESGTRVNPEAYRLHLLGRFHANKWSRDGWEKAVAHLEEAIRLDGRYGPARATLAYSHGIRAYMGLLPPVIAFERAETEARAALALDDGGTEAHMALGLVFYWLHWDWGRALDELERAVEISPGDSIAQSLLGMVLDTLGRHDDALARRSLGYDLDPLSPVAAFNLGYGFMIGRRFPEAIAQFERALELDPRSTAGAYGLGMAQVDGGDPEAGCRTFERSLEEVDSGPTMLGLLGWAKGVAGLEAEAEEVLARLLDEASAGYVSSYHLALVYLGLGDLDNFFVWLEEAYGERSSWMVWFHITPSLDRARGDPRYVDLARRMKLPLGPAL